MEGTPLSRENRGEYEKGTRRIRKVGGEGFWVDDDVLPVFVPRVMRVINTVDGPRGSLWGEESGRRSTIEVGKIEVTNNQIGSTETAVYLEIDTCGEANGTVTVGDVNISGNTIDGIWATVDSIGHTLTKNNLHGNSNAAVTNLATTWIDAEDNWWGDASGPYDSIGTTEVPPCTGNPADEVNSDGLGDDSGDYVAYCPWATEPFVLGLIFVDGFESGDLSEWSASVP